MSTPTRTEAEGDAAGARNAIDFSRAEAAVRELLIAVGEDPDREGLLDPAGVLSVIFDVAHDELIIVRDIEVYSTCEHHLVPFHGVAHVGYIPAKDGRVTGLSKVARLVDLFARRPQVQERLTTQIADALEQQLHVQGAIVVVESEHLCMSMRGVRKPGSRTITSAVRGQLRNPATRAEAMSLLLGGGR